MVEEKIWYKSRTIWGALIAVMASILGGFGFPIDDASQKELTEAAIQLIGALGAVVAIYGRLSATEVIS